MSSWGTGIFEDDTAADVRGEFRDLIADGLSTEEATETVLEGQGIEMKELEIELTEPDIPEDGQFWVALALAQWELGRLLDPIRDRALLFLDNGGDIELWEGCDARTIASRKKVLAKTAEKLRSPQPRPKKVKPEHHDRTQWSVGDAIAYRLASGRWTILQVVGLSGDTRHCWPVMILLDWIGDQAPTAVPKGVGKRHTPQYYAEVSELNDPAHKYSDPEKQKRWETMWAASPERLRALRLLDERDGLFMVYSDQPGQLPADRVRVIAKNMRVTPGEGGFSATWPELDALLKNMFTLE